jgi:hypothetical protein
MPSHLQVNLMEAEKQGLAHPEACGLPARPAISSSTTKALPAPEGAAADSAAVAAVSKDSKGSSKRSKGDDDEELPGQIVDMVFAAPRAATYNLCLVAMSDCWVGVDESVQVCSGCVLVWAGTHCCAGVCDSEAQNISVFFR